MDIVDPFVFTFRAKIDKILNGCMSCQGQYSHLKENRFPNHVLQNWQNLKKDAIKENPVPIKIVLAWF